ncbi:MAG: branched-chain amino acid aminotransferase [Thermoleophilia bacterium]|nr:branched-chain amino acid aminotransferase [Thermoleophilia bacterium]
MDRADLDFANLPFAYHPTDANVRVFFREGSWSLPEVSSDQYLTLHMASVCLHYGQAIFEGLKAYERPDGQVQTFRPRENARRLRRSAQKLLMEPVPEDVFLDAVFRAVAANRRFVPPHASGAALYIRPFQIGTRAEVGVKPSADYLFMVFCTPVGPYYKAGLTPVRLRVEEQIDRAAPGGVGDTKAAGNYAAGMRATMAAKKEGYSEVLYLDARTKSFIDESGSSNFFAIQGDTFITPASPSILASITNKSVQVLARDMGLCVEERPVSVEELGSFDEAGALGTAAVITPVGSITYRGEEFTYAKEGKAGPITTALFERLVAIQTGEQEDPYGWCDVVPGT